jgi:hypothetical protein
VADRQSPIGNPKYQFLPLHRETITSELFGMIERWKAAGMPLDDNARHSFSVWAQTIGGILKVSGFTDFLGNYRTRRTLDDPIRQALSILGAARSGEWLRPGEWAETMAQAGLTKTLIQSHERDTDAGRTRALGVLLSAHENERFDLETESHHLRLKLQRLRARFGGEPHVRYRFEEVERVALPVETDSKAE